MNALTLRDFAFSAQNISCVIKITQRGVLHFVCELAGSGGSPGFATFRGMTRLRAERRVIHEPCPPRCLLGAQ